MKFLPVPKSHMIKGLGSTALWRSAMMVPKQPIVEMDMKFVDGGRCSIFCAGGGWIFPLNWTYRCRQHQCGDSFHAFIGCIRYIHIWGRKKLPGGEERGPISCLLGTHEISWWNGLEAEARRILDVKSIQTRKHFTSLWYISFDFWWVSLGFCEWWAWIYLLHWIFMGL